MSKLENYAGRVFARLGLSVSRSSTLENTLPIEANEKDRAIIAAVKPFTMTSTERIWSLLNSVDYLVDHHISGDFVECGVWRGGSVMAMSLRLIQHEVYDRKIWMYDTFQGMTPPTKEDVEALGGTSAQTLLDSTAIADGNNVWCVADQEDVRRNVESTNYPSPNYVYVKGDVALTLQERFPEKIALLRLDTDWFESTKAELEVLYPRLVPGGVCILDDYGHWAGARKAVDDYFNELGARPLMNPIDFSGRIFIKPLA